MTIELNGSETQVTPIKGVPTRGTKATMIQIEEGAGNLLESQGNPRKVKRQLKALKGKLESLESEERELLAR